MIHAAIAAIGAVGLGRSVWCAWQMDAPTAGLLRRTLNAAYGAGSLTLIWAAWMSSQAA